MRHRSCEVRRVGRTGTGMAVVQVSVASVVEKSEKEMYMQCARMAKLGLVSMNNVQEDITQMER